LIIVVPNLPDKDHLEHVAMEMDRLGSPRIRAIWSSVHGVWFAAEGSHRIAAASKKEMVPIIIDITGEGAKVQREEEETEMTASELEDWLFSDFEDAPKYIFKRLELGDE